MNELHESTRYGYRKDIGTMLNFVSAQSKVNSFTANTRQGRPEVRNELESRLARKGLMIGLSMEHNTVKLHLIGKLHAAGSSIFKDLLKTIVSNGYTSIVLDLTALESIDGAGVAALVWLRNQMLEKGDRMTVTNPTPAMYSKLLAINFHFLVEIESFEYRIAS